MNIEHKPGVLCVIIGAKTDHGRKQIGKVVTLVKYMYFDERYRFADGHVARLIGKEAWLVAGDVSCVEGQKGYAFYTQQHLMPIKDPDQDFVEDQKYKVVVTVNGHEIDSYAGDVKLCASNTEQMFSV